MGLKLFNNGGINQKTSNLLRNPEDLIDSRNMMLDTNGYYTKRPGTEFDTDFAGDDYSDVVFIRSLNQYFFRDSDTDNYYSYENGVKKLIYKFADPLISGNANLSLAEYLNTAIFTHEENQNFTAKYDGNAIYRAGLPAPIVTGTTVGTKFMLYFYQFIDAAGNLLYGPATILPLISETNSFVVPTFRSTGFYAAYLNIVRPPGINVDIDATNRTITYDAISPDIKVGTRIPVRQNNGIEIYQGVNGVGNFHIMLEVESINTGTSQITFTAESIGDYTISVGSLAGGTFYLCGAVSIKYYTSTSETTGYYGLRSDSRYINLNNATNTQTITDVLYGTTNLLSDIYDITTSKLRPPKCKYVLTYGFQLACAPALSFYDFNNQETKYTNNDLVMYSDTSTGDLGESFSEINRQLIGNTYNGEITGLARVKDSVLAFKTRSPYALDGVLIPGQYTMRKIETDEIGCTSYKSIMEVNDGVIFQGQDGLYFTDGYKIDKMSVKLDPFFKLINRNITRSVLNNDLDHYYFWTDLGVVVYDYHFKRWFIWDNVDASKGFTVDNDSMLRFFQLNSAFKFYDITQYNDQGSQIDAYIRSAWLDLGEPGLLKKATFLRLYAFNNGGQQVSLKYYQDWSETKFKGPFTIDMTTEKTVKRNLDIIQNQSFSFEFRNNVVDENLNISGYEVSTAIIQERDKNVK